MTSVVRNIGIMCRRVRVRGSEGRGVREGGRKGGSVVLRMSCGFRKVKGGSGRGGGGMKEERSEGEWDLRGRF